MDNSKKPYEHSNKFDMYKEYEPFDKMNNLYYQYCDGITDNKKTEKEIQEEKRRIRMLMNVLMQNRREFSMQLMALLKKKGFGNYSYREVLDVNGELNSFLVREGSELPTDEDGYLLTNAAELVDRRFSQTGDEILFIGNAEEGEKIDLYEFAATFRYGNSTYSPELARVLKKFVLEQLGKQMEKTINKKRHQDDIDK